MKNNDLLGLMKLKVRFLESMKPRALVECYNSDGSLNRCYRLCRVSLCGHEYRFCLVQVLPARDDVVDDLDVIVFIFSGDRAWREFVEEVYCSHKVIFDYSFD